MCGIMGYYSFGKTIPEKEKITTMFSLLESRGRDACGFAFIEDNNLIVYKKPIKSSELIKEADWKSLDLPRMMILHTRMKTQGSEKNNANNHPLFSKNGIAIVHNGIIYNDKEIIGKKQRDGEVDSESILHLLSAKTKGDRLKRLFDRIEGSFAVAVIDRNDPEKLILIKKDNPIDLYYDSRGDILYFCSEREIMQQSLNIESVTQRGFNLGEKDFHFYEMQNNYALIINKDGVESYQKYYPAKSRWFDRQFHYPVASDFDEIMIECPWCFCQTTYHDGKLFNKCEVCGMGINEEDLYVL
ncbi:MAG: Amidophosphoribosyltransferase [Ignavibacteriaceae bacterium]|nr:Amidophosphoribosyltransferase [Ignavibacteriaceae bacterium]